MCRCTPSGGVTYLQARLLLGIVDAAVHPIRCASSCGWKALRGMTVGDLCATCRHPLWALRVWRFTLAEIHRKDYDDWIDVWFNTEHVRLNDVIADGLCEMLGRRIDDVERRIGLSDAHGMDSCEYRAGDGWYDGLRYEKYDYDWSELRLEYIALRDAAFERQQREQLFLDAQDEAAPQPHDFFEYWDDGGALHHEDLSFRVDDWD